MSEPQRTPSIAEVLGAVLQRVPEERRPLLIAIAERMAASRYRAWAEAYADPESRRRLRECADREEEIARRIEALTAEAASIQREILARHPDLEEINRSLFAGRPFEEQLATQAQGERLGAATWRSFAAREGRAAAREVFLGCAELEEASAEVLDSLLAAKR